MLVFLVLLLAAGYQTRGPGSLELVVLDGIGGRPTPARVELLDREQNGQVADDASPANGDCLDRGEAARMTLAEAVGKLSKPLKNPYTKRTEFYSTGNSTFSSLPPGAYRLTIHKGPEYYVEEREVRISPGDRTRVVVELARWIDLPRQGWYSSDDHLHIARSGEGLNPILSKWMQAEDVHVANLLQWGNSRVSHNTLQYAFGKAGSYQEDGYLLAAGQENPRTYFRGHSFILGADAPIDFPSEYLVYSRFFGEARRRGALSGYAHRGTWLGALYGLAVDLPAGLLNLLEILQQGDEEWWAWYEILNTGFRLIPTAGTDYPCLASLPGRERFYTRLDGPLTYEAWLAGVRRGRTFVTNGPILDFRVAGKEMGEEVLLDRAGAVTIEGRVRFDPKRDRVDRLELIENGQLTGSFPRLNNAGEISFRLPYQVHQSCWLAIRSRGRRLDETSSFSNKSLAHSAPVYLTLKNAPGLAQGPLAQAMARSWIARLEDLEARLAPDQIPILSQPAGSDGVAEAVLQRDRDALIADIRKAREAYTSIAAGPREGR